MTQEAFQAAANYWKEREAGSVKMDRARLLQAVEAYIQANDTCALATGAGDFIRCTPIAYSYHDGCFWMFSEGGEKFIGLSRNANVCLAIFDQYQGFGRLHGMQVMGKARLIEPFSAQYLSHAAYQKIPLDTLRRLERPMHLICVRPVRIDYLCSDLKKQGFASRQSLTLGAESDLDKD